MPTESGTNTITTDTVFVTKTVVDTVEVVKDVKSQADFYASLQAWINPQLDPMVSYYPSVGTEDVKITGSTTIKKFDVYWIVIDFDAGQIYAYSGIFKVTYNGSGSFDIEDQTPSGSPKIRGDSFLPARRL